MQFSRSITTAVADHPQHCRYARDANYLASQSPTDRRYLTYVLNSETSLRSSCSVTGASTGIPVYRQQHTRFMNNLRRCMLYTYIWLSALVLDVSALLS